MGSAASSFGWRAQKPKQVFVFGLYEAGKTTLLESASGQEVDVSIPTIGFNVDTVSVRSINLIAWDVGGREKLRPLARHYYQTTDALIFVVDSAERDDFLVSLARSQLHQHLAEDELQNLPLLVLANKQDLPQARTVSEVCEMLDLHSLRQRKWFVQPTVGTTGEGVAAGFSWLEETLTRRPHHRPVGDTSMTDFPAVHSKGTGQAGQLEEVQALKLASSKVQLSWHSKLLRLLL
eukprot:CAMPEP_0178402658 /NCGR_PEP_ID=MMETSP0689_2-20121128/16959_1 /TAXON_ID=160604 /ORGANISM="Amphidinium massartii, Strain CS-259" /LENGTH=234 /DNA_ID=CAMNT_0020023573 /DNA_START=68 /DNA_END=772 /DNA_ORIENTATION=+